MSLHIQLRFPCKKRSPRFIGPFLVIHQINPVTNELILPAQYRIQPHVSLLKPYHSPVSPLSKEPGPIDDSPLPMVLEDGTDYSVKEILSSRHHGGRLEYLVYWVGYGSEERSLISRDNILTPNLPVEFHASYPQCPAPRGRGPPTTTSGFSALWSGPWSRGFFHGHTRLFHYLSVH